MLMSPCLSCGALTKPNPLSRCEECSTAFHRVQPAREHVATTSARSRGYDSRWRRLSEQARKLQPFCSDCGALTDLQGDHSPEAWKRKERGLAIRLKDIDVVCGRCNRKRGAARGERANKRVGGNPEQGDERLNGG